MTDTPTLAIVRDPTDPVAASRPARWAAEELREALRARGVSVTTFDRLEVAPADATCILLSGPDTPLVAPMLKRTGVIVPAGAESLALVPIQHAGRPVLVAAGRDPRGLVYATLELADRIRTAGADPLAALWPKEPIAQQPANPIRGVARLFVSDVEDKPWFWDRDFWRRYLSMLAAQRFNRVHLAFGIGHDFLRNVLDAYLLFAYPFLVDVPGYVVRASGLRKSERQQNLEALRFASDEAAARGLHFQLGIWTQAYEWTDSPNANYVIEGLTPDIHAAYCRDAIRTVLEACPSIAGVTFRVHGESGVPEGNYVFWREVFNGVVACGRRVELDLHPKGVGQEMINVALQTGLPVTLSPKYTAEHMGLPGHQVAIRELERDASGREGDSFVQHLMNQSGGALRFTRYGNADFLKEDRAYGVFYRIWPGTQRLLLWGDPVLAAGFGRHGSFCGSLGVELCEPLSFKGRRGSGLPGGRLAYANVDLADVSDFEKYLYTYRLFGRLLYDADEDPGVWNRALTHQFGLAAEAFETALAHASRILPLVTSAHHPSAANNRFWPEMYTNMPIVDGHGLDHPYRDTPQPARFDTVSPLDPGLFSSIEAFVREALTEDGLQAAGSLSNESGGQVASSLSHEDGGKVAGSVSHEDGRRAAGSLSHEDSGQVAGHLSHAYPAGPGGRVPPLRVAANPDGPGGRVSPLRVAAMLEELAVTANRALAEAVRQIDDESRPDFQRATVDVAIQVALGRFFAAKLRAGVAYAVYRRGDDRMRLGQALEAYREARAAWVEAVEHGRVYRADITVGGEPWLRGHWADRLAAIDADLAAMEADWHRLGSAAGGAEEWHRLGSEPGAAPALAALEPPPPLAALDPPAPLDALEPAPPRGALESATPHGALEPAPPLGALEPPPPAVECTHSPPIAFVPGQPLSVELRARSLDGRGFDALLHYRHVNNAESYVVQPMQSGDDGCLRAEIPADYTASAYPLQYYFVLRRGPAALRYPDLEPDLANQAYFVVRQSRSAMGRN